MPSVRWESATRYYLAAIRFDLFGDLVLSRWWGSSSSRLGGEMHERVRSLAEGEQRLVAIGRDRKRHGYRLLSQVVGQP